MDATVQIKGKSIIPSFSKLDYWKFQGSRLESSSEMFKAFWEIMEGFRETFKTFGSWKSTFHVIIFFTFESKH